MANFKNTTKFHPDQYQKTKNPYTIIQDHIIEDLQSHPLALAIYVKIFSYSGTPFIINKTNIRKQLKITEYLFNKNWRVLLHKGYVEKTLIQQGVHWDIIANPRALETEVGESYLEHIKKDIL